MGRLSLEQLEPREMPAVSIVFNYDRDLNGFFNDPFRRQLLQAAADSLTSRFTDELQAIIPGGGNSWRATFFHPATGSEETIFNMTVPQDQLIVFAGGRVLGGSIEAAEAGPGGLFASGTTEFIQTVQARGQTRALDSSPRDFGPWGGAISFDTATNWYFGLDTSGLKSNQLDFYSVALHEIGHILGFGTSASWDAQTVGSKFIGVTSSTVFGSAVPLDISSGLGHWSSGLTLNSQPVIMQPLLPNGTRRDFTPLDLAALRDVGWTFNAPGLPTLPGVPLPPGQLPVNSTDLMVISGSRNTAQSFAFDTSGMAQSIGQPFTPFASVPGVVRASVGDVNGDGVVDTVYATGPGGGALLRIINGRDGSNLLSAGIFDTFPGEAFTDIGLHLVCADFNGDGRAEIAVCPDQGGGARVQVFRFDNGNLVQTANFFAIEDLAFRGGGRLGAGDINGDSRADLVVSAGFGGGPRVAVYSGPSLSSEQTPIKLTDDFFAFEQSLRDGCFVAVGDLNGDGRADLVFGGGPGGGPRVLALNGLLVLTNQASAFANPLANFFAFDPDTRGGVRVAVKDADGDAFRDLVTASGDNAMPLVRIYLGRELAFSDGPIQTFVPVPETILTGGVFVG